ncbi:hypothetical protein [Legionella septentrionalis]|uniref:hypothetical protein n=1 Tax=Legionella septentrionalis TaxID=2498109 RepID=UPI000F8C5033|nr:hypothetical protein [Legionella septentrionalis]RUR12986.1 hypothetical protein ELY10_11080 [Legionella septentrionalis]
MGDGMSFLMKEKLPKSHITSPLVFLIIPLLGNGAINPLDALLNDSLSLKGSFFNNSLFKVVVDEEASLGDSLA